MALTRDAYDNEQPTMGDLAAMAAIHTVLSMVDTVKIGRIISYAEGTQRAEVELLQFEPFGIEDDAVDWDQPEPAFDVPVLFPGAAYGGLYFPLVAGDFVLLMINERSLDDFKATGEAGPQSDSRRWDTQDAIALPLRSPLSAAQVPSTPSTVLEGALVRLSAHDAAASVSRDPEVQANLQAIQTTLTAWEGFKAALGAGFTAAAVTATSGGDIGAASAFTGLATLVNGFPIPAYSATPTAVEEVLVP